MDINVTFSRELLKKVMEDIRTVTTAAERKDAWVYHFGRDDWEFHGPDGYYWWGSADNAYDARQQGWSAWWKKLEADAEAMRKRLQGQRQRIDPSHNAAANMGMPVPRR